MRQYRGLTKDGKWVYGWYFELVDGVYQVRRSYIKQYDTPWHDTEVIPETVGQSTGLKDKKRIAAYFGDKVIHDNWDIGVVKWHEKKLRVCFEWEDGAITYPLEHYDYINFVIIGTIHDSEAKE